jgi:acetyl-CoA carboxylase biotin carboxyl carrier protein
MAEIQSPLPGVFYRSPSPDKPPFIETGDPVQAGQTVGIIEIMKQFTEVKAEVAGTLEEFKVENEGAVTPGDVIAVIGES